LFDEEEEEKKKTGEGALQRLYIQFVGINTTRWRLWIRKRRAKGGFYTLANGLSPVLDTVQAMGRTISRPCLLMAELTQGLYQWLPT
jgi:hypothetical protein